MQEQQNGVCGVGTLEDHALLDAAVSTVTRSDRLPGLFAITGRSDLRDALMFMGAPPS